MFPRGWPETVRFLWKRDTSLLRNPLQTHTHSNNANITSYNIFIDNMTVSFLHLLYVLCYIKHVVLMVEQNLFGHALTPHLICNIIQHLGYVVSYYAVSLITTT